ncbi:MAG: hypothetical protein HC821_02500, partial [Lewinella sp.]|nr:hypothetical protein [Lewinella sp.]
MQRNLIFLLLLLMALGFLGAQATQLKDLYPGDEDGSPNNFFVNGDLLYFRADSAEAGVELWVSDGTGQGTRMLLDLNPGDTVAAGNSNPDEFILLGQQLLFKARNNVNGLELWTTDGTAEGTLQVSDIQPGSGNGTPFDLLVANGLLYFTANDGTNGSELWTSDGTASGTQLAVEIQPGSGSGNPGNP